MTSKGSLCFFLSQQSPSVVLSYLSCLMLRKVSCFQERCNHSFLYKNQFHLESSSQGTAENRFTFCCYPNFFEKVTGNTVSNYTADKQPRGHLLPCNLVLNPQCQERAHVWVDNWVTDELNKRALCVMRVVLPGCSHDMACTSICTQMIEACCGLLVLTHSDLNVVVHLPQFVSWLSEGRDKANGK